MIAKRFVITIISVVFGLSFAFLLFYPYKNAPSGFEWLVAMIEGRGKPHYPISGSAESRMEDLFNRHPRLRPRSSHSRALLLSLTRKDAVCFLIQPRR